MSSPILLFVIILVIDLVIKSAKDKAKIERERSNPRTSTSRPVNTNTTKPRAMDELKNILKEEIEKEKQRNHPARKTVVESSIKKQEEVKKKVLEDFQISYDPVVENREKGKNLQQENSLKKDFLRGIIFSEILSEPKSVQNQRNHR